jgi:hypothetical protein
MEKMKPLLNFDNLSLEDLVNIQNSLQTAIIKKYQEREEKALYEFKKAYEKFREIPPEDLMYVEVYCEGCEDNIHVDLLTLLDDFFGL